MRNRSITNLYDLVLSPYYDIIQSHMVPLKQRSIDFIDIKKGDTVLLFCCGTGLEIPSINDCVGDNGKIIGVDISAGMLSILEKRIQRNHWQNITLYNEDVRHFNLQKYSERKVDVGICTLGLSVIPDNLPVLENLINSVKDGGIVLVADTKISRWKFSLLHNFTSVGISYLFGSNYHLNKCSDEIIKTMKNRLKEFEIAEFLWNTYYIAYGKKSSVPIAS